ncbi:MAG: PrsW family intramembrane metalloprotease [Erysipelotrichaceae bacterium]|nr:PrsW family intramembrane metalloprotease [Erysipelotrichaceae bacterium]
MFYYLLTPIMKFNVILIISAVVPAIFLMVRIYRKDKLEKENGRFLWNLVKAGIFSSLIAMISEKILVTLLGKIFDPSSEVYRILLYFLVVGISEEGAKYYLLKKNSWNSSEFDCVFDGVIYAVFVSLGFALWENISYVLNFGLPTAIVRAITAIPGHASFGVFMGVFYSAAKLYEVYGDGMASSRCKVLALLVPILLHGLYDYIATLQVFTENYLFMIFIALLFIAANYVVGKVSKYDRYMA